MFSPLSLSLALLCNPSLCVYMYLLHKNVCLFEIQLYMCIRCACMASLDLPYQSLRLSAAKSFAALAAHALHPEPLKFPASCSKFCRRAHDDLNVKHRKAHDDVTIAAADRLNGDNSSPLLTSVAAIGPANVVPLMKGMGMVAFPADDCCVSISARKQSISGALHWASGAQAPNGNGEIVCGLLVPPGCPAARAVRKRVVHFPARPSQPSIQYEENIRSCCSSWSYSEGKVAVLSL